MSAAADTRLRGRTRWSAAARCPRMAAYGLLGTEPAESSARQRRLMRRGRRIGAEVMDDFAAKYGEENIVREKAVTWPTTGLPLGELHSDGFVIPEKMAVEVKSSTSPASILDDALVQLGGEILYDPDAEHGCLALADPTGWNETELLPVLLTEELTERVENVAAQVVTAATGGELPARVCHKPSDAQGKFCPFVDVCFDGWQPPDPHELDSDVADLARRLKTAQDRERAAKASVAEVEAERRELADLLGGWELQPGVDYVGDGVKVRRTHVTDSPKLSYSTAAKAGVFQSPIWTPEHEALLQPFVKLSGAYDRWSVTILEERLLELEDFGDEAPWDDEDLDG